MAEPILVVVGLILVGGSLIYWIQHFSSEYQYTFWILPWLFGALVAGGYFGWSLSAAASTTWIILFTIGGCFLGLVCGVVGLISDPKMEEGPLDQFASTLVLLGMPVGVVIGLTIGTIWIIPAAIIGFFLGPLLFGLLVPPLISLSRKAFSWSG